MRVLVGVSTTEGLHKESISNVNSFKQVRLMNCVHHLHVTADLNGKDEVIAVFKNWDFIVVDR